MAASVSDRNISDVSPELYSGQTLSASVEKLYLGFEEVGDHNKNFWLAYAKLTIPTANAYSQMCRIVTVAKRHASSSCDAYLRERGYSEAEVGLLKKSSGTQETILFRILNPPQGRCGIIYRA